MAAPFLIKAVTALLADVPASDKTLLDVSCKEGDVLQALKPRGFVLRGTNFEVQGPVATGPALNGIPIDYGVDVLQRLPYDDASFDVVLLIEVIVLATATVLRWYQRQSRSIVAKNHGHARPPLPMSRTHTIADPPARVVN